MYNRYIGNTGQYIRVEDNPRQGPSERRPAPNARGLPPPPLHPQPLTHDEAIPHAAPDILTPKTHIKNKPSLLGSLGGGLSGLFNGLGGLGGKGGLSNITGGLKGMFDHLPFGLDIGDLLLLLLLVFFFIESGDEEFLIILGFLIFSIYKDSKIL